MYEVIVRRDGVEVSRSMFADESAAHEAAALVRSVDMHVLTDVEKRWAALYNYRPTLAERQLLRAVWPHNKVAAIKYARSQSTAGLKEAKDWCDEHLG